jgi:hypothetical protein
MYVLDFLLASGLIILWPSVIHKCCIIMNFRLLKMFQKLQYFCFPSRTLSQAKIRKLLSAYQTIFPYATYHEVHQEKIDVTYKHDVDYNFIYCVYSNQ